MAVLVRCLRRHVACTIGVIGLSLFAACRGGADGDRSADANAPDPPNLQGPDLRRGELLGLACQACHALTPAGGPEIGPSLYGVFGRPAASVADFDYSDALRNADFLWTAQQLDAWLQAPTTFLPGTSMAFAGYGNAHDRESLIAWLQQATAIAER
jgi:cytochrome c